MIRLCTISTEIEQPILSGFNNEDKYELLKNKAEVLLAMGRARQSTIYAKKGLEIAKEAGIKEWIFHVHEISYAGYKALMIRRMHYFNLNSSNSTLIHFGMKKSPSKWDSNKMKLS